MPRFEKGFRFYVIDSKASGYPTENVGILIRDNWDDYSFRTTFDLLIFDADGLKTEVGLVKIGSKDMKDRGVVELPGKFQRLDEGYFSLGQSDQYYDLIKKLGDRARLMVFGGLRDIAFRDENWKTAENLGVTEDSLFRTVIHKVFWNQYRRIAKGGARLTPYKFSYSLPKQPKQRTPETPKLQFDILPESYPPTNIHTIIGRNGVGKTRLLRLMLGAIAGKKSSGIFQYHKLDASTIFSNLVSVSFSAFDNFEIIKDGLIDDTELDYRSIGLRRTSNTGHGLGTPKSAPMLNSEFVRSAETCRFPGRIERWKKALETLESDPGFKERELSSLANFEIDYEANKDGQHDSEDLDEKFFKSLSSGHQIVLLTLTRLIETVEEKTLVLVDEPEGHLHPPLLSAFIRALSDLLVDRNGVAIIATHSPVVLQEVPKSCVYILERTGDKVKAERPSYETFGENLGILTREVFGYEVTESGFHKMLKTVAEKEDSYEDALKEFGNQLGGEAKATLRTLFLNRTRF